MNYKIICCLFFTILPSVIIAEKGFCCVPVTDLVGKQLNHEQPYADNPDDHYCTRHSQLLFNEQVEIISSTKKEVKVKIQHVYYILGKNKTKQTIYSVNKDAICTLAKLSKIDQAKIAAPLSFENKQKNNQNTITLLLPFTDPETNLTYSAGTRFIKTQKQKKKKITVYCYDPETHQFKILKIPRSLCVEKQPKTNQEKRTLFLTILHKWIPKNGYIPYVFGGFSIGVPLETNNFYVQKIGSAKVYQRPEADNETVKYGIDCSQLIARAAQIAGIDYYYKNTSTLRQELAPIGHHEAIQDGDILVWSGHTCVVSDIKKGLIIEARGYEHGYGIVQEIKLSEQFENITHFEQLQKAIQNNKEIIRLNKTGQKVQTIRDMNIMKLPV